MQPLALYIHWPFCKKKCPYCDFNSHVRDHIDQSRWRTALLAELRHMHSLAPAHTLTSIFFGGGTPSLMSPDTAHALIEEAKTLWPPPSQPRPEEGDRPTMKRSEMRGDESRSEKGRRHAPLGERSELEITLEANPTSVETSTFPLMKQAGINRVSLGIQSLRPESLSFLGREHSVPEALAALDSARTHFPRHSFDLIYALPNQSLKDWETELTEALSYAGQHLSLYQLTIEPNTMFHHAYHTKKAFRLPPDDLAADLYTLTQSLMESRGLPAYEISNHASPGEESRHNLSYWRGHSYIGVGPGAHGRIRLPHLKDTSQRHDRGVAQRGGGEPPLRGDEGGATLRSVPSCLRPAQTTQTIHATLTHSTPERWLECVERDGHAIASLSPLTPEETAEERLMTALRLRTGLDFTTLTETERAYLASRIPQRALDILTQESLLEISPTHWRTTPKGKLLLNSILHQLLA